MLERRQLSFAILDEVMYDVEQLLHGYEILGQWSLGQICKHLSSSVNLPIDVVPDLTSSTIRESPRRALIRERFLQAVRFPDGVLAPFAELVPRAGLEDPTEVEALRAALTRFRLATGPFSPHPFLGLMTKEEWARFHCLHSAHHLGFVVPQPAGY